MRLMILVFAAAATATPAHAQETVDPRALEACQSEGTFVQVSECLPDTHVAFAVIDAFDATYAAEAAPLKTVCLERNEAVSGAATCIVNAIRSAIDLAERLPAGASLNDAVFDAVREPEDFEVLETAMTEARAAFPEKTFWGGGMFYPYQ